MPNCIVRGCIRTVEGHKFPKNEALRKKWVAAVGREETFRVTKNSKVCRSHFLASDYMTEGYYTGLPLDNKILKKDVIPSVFPSLWTESHRDHLVAAIRHLKESAFQDRFPSELIPSQLPVKIAITSNQIKRKNIDEKHGISKKIKSAVQESTESAAEEDIEEDDTIEQDTINGISKSGVLTAVLLLGNESPEFLLKRSSVHCQTQYSSLLFQCQGTQTDQFGETSEPKSSDAQTGTPILKCADKCIQVTDMILRKYQLNMTDLIVTDQQSEAFTGCNGPLISRLVEIIDDYYDEGVDRKPRSFLSLREKVLLSLMKLKLDLPFPALGALFKISKSTAAKTFTKTCNCLISAIHKLKREGMLVIFPPSCDIHTLMTLLKKYKEEQKVQQKRIHPMQEPLKSEKN